MKIAIGGKGGSGKTTVAGTLARVLAERGQQVVALDDDSNPNLAVTLGLPHGQAASLPAIPRDWLEEKPDGEGGTRLELKVLESAGSKWSPTRSVLLEMRTPSVSSRDGTR